MGVDVALEDMVKPNILTLDKGVECYACRAGEFGRRIVTVRVVPMG
jgi:hypothetical protein